MTFSIVSSDKGVLQHAPEIHSGALMAMDVEGMFFFFRIHPYFFRWAILAILFHFTVDGVSRVSNLAGLDPNSIDDNDEVFVDQSLTSKQV